MTKMNNSTKDHPKAGDAPVCPVCERKVVTAKSKSASHYSGYTYWFCSEGCRAVFDTYPRAYFIPEYSMTKAQFQKYLERMARE